MIVLHDCYYPRETTVPDQFGFKLNTKSRIVDAWPALYLAGLSACWVTFCSKEDSELLVANINIVAIPVYVGKIKSSNR